jgi:heterodisulfide reductase subunit A
MDFATDGVYISGSAKWPVDLTESITQGYAAASRASTILSHNTLEVEGATSSLPEYNKALCTGCEVCITVCPYKAISKNEEDEIVITQVLCKGCGVCGATCTNHAIVIRHFTDEQIMAEIDAFGGK